MSGSPNTTLRFCTNSKQVACVGQQHVPSERTKGNQQGKQPSGLHHKLCKIGLFSPLLSSITCFSSGGLVAASILTEKICLWAALSEEFAHVETINWRTIKTK